MFCDFLLTQMLGAPLGMIDWVSQIRCIRFGAVEHVNGTVMNELCTTVNNLSNIDWSISFTSNVFPDHPRLIDLVYERLDDNIRIIFSDHTYNMQSVSQSSYGV
jgi:hypothetical protein